MLLQTDSSRFQMETADSANSELLPRVRRIPSELCIQTTARDSPKWCALGSQVPGPAHPQSRDSDEALPYHNTRRRRWRPGLRAPITARNPSDHAGGRSAAAHGAATRRPASAASYSVPLAQHPPVIDPRGCSSSLRWGGVPAGPALAPIFAAADAGQR